MKTKVPQPDTKESLFMNAINVLQILGQEKVADDLDRRMEKLMIAEEAPKMRLGKVIIKLEYVVDLDSEHMIDQAKNAIYEDLMNAYRYNEIYHHIKVTEQDNNLEPSDIPRFLTEETYIDDIT
jgi:hypothetical protein